MKPDDRETIAGCVSRVTPESVVRAMGIEPTLDYEPGDQTYPILSWSPEQMAEIKRWHRPLLDRASLAAARIVPKPIFDKRTPPMRKDLRPYLLKLVEVRDKFAARAYRRIKLAAVHG